MIPDDIKSYPDVQALAAHDPDAIENGKYHLGELTLEIPAARIVAVGEFLKTHAKYNLLAGLTCRDNYPLEPRFQVVYHLFSIDRKECLRLKVNLPGENPAVDTITPVWPAAGWHEREVFDLFGVRFNGHPDLRRILLPDHFEGYPLRRDFPTEGHR